MYRKINDGTLNLKILNKKMENSIKQKIAIRVEDVIISDASRYVKEEPKVKKEVI